LHLGDTLFFRELGLELQGRATIEGEWAGRVNGLADQRVEIAMMRTPDGHGRLELSRFLTPPAIADHRNAPVNALGYLRVMFAMDDIVALYYGRRSFTTCAVSSLLRQVSVGEGVPLPRPRIQVVRLCRKPQVRTRWRHRRRWRRACERAVRCGSC
jgi:hypothetical protein